MNMESHVPLPLAPEAPGIARRELRRLLLEWGICERVEEALLVVSELATNAVRYGAAPLELRVSCKGGTLKVAVRDGQASDLPYPRQLTHTEPHGRGMHLVAASSHRWGWDHDQGFKVVWAEILVPGSARDDC